MTDNTTILNSLPEALTRPWKDGFTSSLAVVFISGVCILTAAFILSLLTKELPLRGTTAPATAPVAGDPAAAEGQPTIPGEPDHRPDRSRELVGSSTAKRSGAGIRSSQAMESPHPACPVSLDRVRERRRERAQAHLEPTDHPT